MQVTQFKKTITSSLIGLATILLMPIPSYADFFYYDALSYPSTVNVFPGYNAIIDDGLYVNKEKSGTSALRISNISRSELEPLLEYATTNDLSWTRDTFSGSGSMTADYGYAGKIDKGNAKISGIANSGRILATANGWFDNSYDSGDFSTNFYAIYNGIQASAKDRIQVFALDNGQDAGTPYWENSTWEFNILSGTPKIFPDSYPDEIVLSPEEIKQICPWIDQYTYNENSETYTLTSDQQKVIFNQYKNSNYMRKDWVNSMAGFNILSSDITTYRSIPTYDKYTKRVITLEDNVETLIPTGATAGKASEDGYSWTYYYFSYNPTMTSTWFTSPDKQVFSNIGSSKDDSAVVSKSDSYTLSGDHVIFDMYRRIIKLPQGLKRKYDNVYTEYAAVNLSNIIGDSSTFYLRRTSSATGAMSAYNNITSPPKKVRTKLALESIDVKYAGPAVVQGSHFNEKDVKITAKYTDSDTPTVYNGDGNYITYITTEIYNVGNNNYIQYTYTDPRTGDVKTGEFVVPGVLPKPVSISATYQGNPVVEDTAYNPTQVRISITYDNGTISTYMGSSLSIGITDRTDYKRSDVDINTVVNTNDLTLLNMALNGEPLSDSQREQADINEDGVIDDRDYETLQNLISKIVPYGDKTFYASYMNLFEKGSTNKLQFAEFTIPSEKKKPYKLVVTTQPLKKNYLEGEDFDPTGMILNVFYNNGSTQIITFEDKEQSFDGLELGNDEFPAKNMQSTQTRLPITYTENETTVETELNLKVRQRTLTSIKVTNPPETITYYSGENFNRTGMEVTAYYDEMSTLHEPDQVILNDRDYDVENEKRLPDSRDYVLIKADNPAEVDTGFIKILKARITSPAVLDKGTHATFHYDNGSGPRQVTGTIVGNHPITISYTDRGVTKTAIQPVDVLQRKLVSIAVEQMPYKTVYNSGDSFDSTGLILRATYTDGSREFIYPKTAERNGYTIVNPMNLTPERKEIVVEYVEGDFAKDTIVPITVNDPQLDSLKAIYMGPNVYTNSDFDPSDVIITATYTNGKAEAFRGSDTNIDGTNKFQFLNEAGVVSTQVTKIGENVFSVGYGGLSADFIVIGVKRPDQIDFSGSVAKSRRKWAMWEEEFRAIKIKSVADYINGAVNDLNIGTITADEYHVVEKTKVTEDRAVLVEYNGTARIQDLTNASITTSPLLNFMREGTWRQPETEINIEYKARTRGYLFPETPNPKFAADGSYLDSYYQEIPSIWNGDDGWSDWYKNGDSAGSVFADRIAYRYDFATSPEVNNEIMYLDRLKIRLTGARVGDTPHLNVTVVDVDGVTHTYNGITENDTIERPAKIRITLGGQITVTDENGNAAVRNFADVYKVFYRSTTDELINWSEAGEWAGTDGVQMQSVEIKLMLKDASFDKGSVSERPIFSQHPKNVSAIIGDKVMFSVSAVGQTLTYQWFKDGVAIPGANSATYRTDEVTIQDNGTHYWCEVSNGMFTATSAQALLKVSDIFPIITKNPNNIEGQVGDVVTVSVAATCKDPSVMRYTWEIRNGATWELLPGTSDTADLQLELNENLHGKDIRCKISNGRGYTYTNAARINCSQPPEIEIKSSSNYVLKSRQNVRFNANVIASSGNTTFQWIVDGIQQNEASSVFTYKPETIGNHEIRCIITDKYGTSEDTFILHVGDIPELTLKDTLTKQEDGTSNLSVTAAITEHGDGGPLKVEWRVDGELVTVTGNEFKKTGLKTGDQYTIACTIANEYGSSTKVLNILIKGEEG